MSYVDDLAALAKSDNQLLRKEALGLAIEVAGVLIKTGIGVTTEEIVADAKAYLAFLTGASDTSDQAQPSAETQTHSP